MRKLNIISIIIIWLLLVLITTPYKSAQNPTFRSQNTTTTNVDFVFDTFTESSSIDLALHTGETGASWTDHPHANYAAQISIDSVTDRVFSDGTGGYFASGVHSNANYYVQADFCVNTVIAQSIGVTGRMSTTDDTLYLGRLVDGATWQLRKATSGAFTTLGTSTSNIPSPGNCITGRLVMNVDQISFVINNGTTVIGPFTDTAITSVGRAGIRNNGAATSTTGTHLDNFSARGL